jgi:DNA-binding NarL/FixJ family response regulator
VTLRLFAVTDIPLLQWKISKAAHGDGDLEMVGRAGSSHAAERRLNDTRPDVVFIALPLPDALCLASRLRDQRPELGIAIMAEGSEDDVVFRVMEAGASAVVFTDVTVPVLLATLKHAAHAPHWFTADRSRLIAAISRLDQVTDERRLSPVNSRY